ncbi:hypothetical protein AZF37_05985 [endosymbiont 'TC1' of Trimyema compressum]|nr:hypothetical protein AZF37_05985 [endosymbiont 'TC1' of Trimyema compressum]
MFKRYYLEPIKYQTIIFKELVKNKIIHQSNPSIVALQFFSPIYMLIINCEKGFLLKSEAQENLKNHIEQFIQLYYQLN